MGKKFISKLTAFLLAIISISTLGVVGYSSYLNINIKEKNEEVDVLGDEAFVADESYCMYGVHDQGGGNTQFFHLVMDKSEASAIGPFYPRYDIESADIHPYTKELIAVSGGGNNQGDRDGEIFRFDKNLMQLVQIGDTGVRGDNEIVAGSFHPKGEYWAFQENVGFITIGLEPENMGEIELKWDVNTTTYSKNWEGLAWNNDGSMLYASAGKNLFEWNPVTQTAAKVCGNQFLPGTTEALEFRNDGKLYGGYHNSTIETLNIFEIDIANCATYPTDYATPYNDVETITFDLCSETLPTEEPPVEEPPVEEPPVEEPPVEEPPVEEPPVVIDPPDVDPPIVTPPTGEPVEDGEVQGVSNSDENGQILGGTTTMLANTYSTTKLSAILIIVIGLSVFTIGSVTRWIVNSRKN